MALTQFNTRINNAKKRILNRSEFVKNADTPFDVIYDDGLAKLRHYPLATQATENHPLPTARKKTPIFIVTPLAVNTSVYDLMPTRSFVRFLLSHGYDVYMVDWGKPTLKHSKLGFDYYVAKVMPELVRAVREYSGKEKISLHGWSLGGIFSYLYCAYSNDEDIKNLILVGAPVDGHSSGYVGFLCNIADKIYDGAESLIKLHPRQLPNKLIHSYGWVNVLGFKAVDPFGTLKSYIKMFNNLNDEQALIENATKNDFLLTMADYPGAIVKDMAVGFWIENAIYKKELTIKNKLIDLSTLKHSLLAISGDSDMLVTTAAALPIMDLCQHEDKTHMEIAGGHVSIVSSKKTSQEVWPKIVAWLDARE